MKEVSQRFHLHETLGAGTRRETESRREAARGWEGGDGSRGQTVHRYRVCFKGDKNVPELPVVMAEQPRSLLKMHCILPFVWTAWYANYISNCWGKKASSDWVLGNFKSTHFTAILPVPAGE